MCVIQVARFIRNKHVSKTNKTLVYGEVIIIFIDFVAQSIQEL